MYINVKNFATILTGQPDSSNFDLDIEGYFLSKLNRYKDARYVAENTWLEAWSLYSGTPTAVDYQREQQLRTVGDVNIDWRHKINTGKAFQVVETVHPYLMGALFPTKMWFDLEPKEAGYAKEAPILRKFLSEKFIEGKFQTEFSKYLRQLLVCGFSVMALPWRCETKEQLFNTKIENKSYASQKTIKYVYKSFPDFQTINVFDSWLDPDASSPNESDFIRRIRFTKADVIHKLDSGEYQNITPIEVCNLSSGNVVHDYKKQTLNSFQGINSLSGFSLDDEVEVYEYWGDVHLDGISFLNVCATFIGDRLVKFQPNEFWGGKPFVIGSITELIDTPYSIGLLQPNLGLLHEYNIITNQRLDNGEIAINKIFTLKNTSSLKPEDVGVEPGKVLLVDEHTDIQPLNLGNQDYSVSYTEASVLEKSIDSNVGTGSMVSANSYRSGERVTAAEVQAVKDAGGNRLSSICQHISETSLMTILNKVWRSAQQFTRTKESVRMSGSKPKTAAYYEIDVDSINNGYKLYPIGTSNITDKEVYVRKRMDLIAFAAQVPEMQQKINYDALLYDIINNMGFDDPSAYIKEENELPSQPGMPNEQPLPNEQQQQPTPGISSLDDLNTTNMSPSDLAYQLGNSSLQRVVDANLQADGGANYLRRTTGVDINEEPQPV